jgi:hypothetical protein
VVIVHKVLLLSGLFVACVLMSGGQRVSAKGAGLLTNTVTNDTGQTANSLVVNVIGVPGVTALNLPDSPYAPPLTYQGATVDKSTNSAALGFQSASSDPSDQVAAGAPVSVTWRLPTEGNSSLLSAQFSNNGTVTGTATSLISIEVNQAGTSDTGIISVINNSPGPIFYSDLLAFSHADPTFFTPDMYTVGGAQTGEFSQLALPPQGELMPGTNFVGTVNADTGDIGGGVTTHAAPDTSFQPADTSPFYDVGFVEVDGGLYAIGAENAAAVLTAPEPAALTMLFSAGVSLAGVSARRLWRCLRTRAADRP